MAKKILDNKHKSKLLNVITKLKEYFENESTNNNDISIFLCGGNSPSQSQYRRILGKEIIKKTSKYSYTVHYPEDIFTNLLVGPRRKDLMTLETLLGDSVRCIVILLQSAGTYTELGVFSSHPDLQNKLIVITENKYKKEKSFINLGPIRYLKTQTKSKLIYVDNFDISNIEKFSDSLLEKTREFELTPPKYDLLLNPVSSIYLYLAIIYVFDGISKDILLLLIKSLLNDKSAPIKDMIEVIIDNLIKTSKVLISSGLLYVTDAGITSLISEYSTRRKSSEIQQLLTESRLAVLNLTMRKYYTFLWSGR